MTSNDTIVDLIDQIQNKLDAPTEASNNNIQELLNELKNALSTYESNNQENTLSDEINFALEKQSLTIDEKNELLNTKIRQIKIATERNTQTKNMLTVFIIINIVVILVFIGLIVIKSQN